MNRKPEHIKVLKKVEKSCPKEEVYIHDHEIGLLHLLIPRHLDKAKQILEKLSCKSGKNKLNLQT